MSSLPFRRAVHAPRDSAFPHRSEDGPPRAPAPRGPAGQPAVSGRAVALPGQALAVAGSGGAGHRAGPDGAACVAARPAGAGRDGCSTVAVARSQMVWTRSTGRPSSAAVCSSATPS